jgi:hypothetical protein
MEGRAPGKPLRKAAQQELRPLGRLDVVTIASIGRSVLTGKVDANDRPAPSVAIVMTPPAGAVNEPDPPIEADPVRDIAPNETNPCVQALSSTHKDGHKDLRIDTPHLDRMAGGFGITGKEKVHPALHRVLTGRQSTLLDLSGIFDR